MPLTIIEKYFSSLTEDQITKFSQLEDLYTDWNSKINVISRKDIEELYIRHVLHSLGIAKVQAFNPGVSILDVGTGGGFPGIPLAILFPETNFYLIDAIGKKINVVNEVASALNLQNVKEDSILKLNIFMDEEIYPMQIKYVKNEVIKTKWGKINCLVFTPLLQEGRVFKDAIGMRIWISDDENKLMIKAETKIIVGVIKAELSSFKGLKSPLSITE